MKGPKQARWSPKAPIAIKGMGMDYAIALNLFVVTEKKMGSDGCLRKNGS